MLGANLLGRKVCVLRVSRVSSGLLSRPHKVVVPRVCDSVWAACHHCVGASLCQFPEADRSADISQFSCPALSFRTSRLQSQQRYQRCALITAQSMHWAQHTLQVHGKMSPGKPAVQDSVSSEGMCMKVTCSHHALPHRLVHKVGTPVLSC